MTHPEKSCRVWCIWVWSLNLDDEEGLVHKGLSYHETIGIMQAVFRVFSWLWRNAGHQCISLCGVLFLQLHGLCDVLGRLSLSYVQDVIWCNMIHLLTAIGLLPGGSSTVHICTQTIHKTTQLTTLVGMLSGIRTKSGQNKINNEITA
jgi:hypothetical protein